MAILKTKKDITNVGQDTKKMGHSYIARGNVNVKHVAALKDSSAVPQKS